MTLAYRRRKFLRMKLLKEFEFELGRTFDGPFGTWNGLLCGKIFEVTLCIIGAPKLAKLH